ncbi:hypothetical protein CRG98_039206 [Punica granatum]|uniref:Uncharacterized protein n=1 Tax=Punica granatum TaxID=22663 RepID=A0A2I0I8U8_PUNGR|nr:hypothetical protein CRG98_039206 [Punica granatum]
MTTEAVAGTKKGASHDLWLPPLIEHATKEGQAVSTPFWSTSSNGGLPTKARDTIHHRETGGLSGSAPLTSRRPSKTAHRHPGTTAVMRQASDDLPEFDLISRGTFQCPQTSPGEPSGHVHGKQRP